VHRVHSKRLPGRRGVPERDGHVVARRDAPRVGATPRPPAPAAHPARVRDRPNDLGEERARAGGVGRGHGERGAVARRRRAEVAQPEHALARRVAKQGAVRGVELGRRHDLGEVLHAGRLEVDERVRGGRRRVEVPEVDAQVVRRQERLPVGAEGQRVDVVGVRAGVRAGAAGGERGLSRDDAREDERRAAGVHAPAAQPRFGRRRRRGRARGGAGARGDRPGRGAAAGRRARARRLAARIRVEARQRDHRPVVHLPQFHRFVVRGQEQARAGRRAAGARRGGVRGPDPAHAVDLFLDLQRFQVVELGLVRLKLGQVPVVERGGRGGGRRAGVGVARRRGSGVGPFKQDDAAAAVAGGQVGAVGVELDGGDDVG